MKQNYYIIGSKYGTGNDIFPQMLEKNAVSVGYATNYDLSKLVGHSEDEIVEYLSKKREESASYSVLKLFLNLKEGDLIAIKSKGSPVGRKSRLVICGYAVVKKNNGKIYEHDPKSLGHLVYVDFLEININKELELGYGKTIHKLTNTDDIKEIFGAYYDPNFTTPIKGRFFKGTTLKNTSSQIRIINTSYVIENAHNKLQQEFYNYLVEEYGEDKVKMEENFVDLKLIEHDKITFFEVKPYSSVSLCIRESLGQILDYLWKDKDANKVTSKIVVVGHTKPTKDEIKYIEFLKDNLKIEFDYQCFDSDA